MLIRTGLVALALTVAAPMAAQAQVIDFGGGAIDLRSNKQRMKENYREQVAREQYRQDAYRGGRYRDRDMSTGSVRRYDDRGDYGRGRGRGDYDRY